MDYIKQFFWLVVAGTFLASCKQEVDPPSEIFKRTWYAGKAELSSYTLEQARYGEIRNGEAVLIFVTEDFSTDKLVKLDEPEKVNNKARVLKMNMTKKFITGVYPYSMMLSSFTPVSKEGKERTMKVTCSVQEWCGHTFSALKLNGNNYHWRLHSYFEKEGEQDEKLDGVLTEDEIWNRIRINPSSLPQGKVEMLPGLFWQRLSHTKMKKEEATASVSKADSFFIKDPAVQLYTIHYPAAQRTLQIYFDANFPHRIIGWQETYPDGFGANKKMLTTKAKLKKSTWLDYWKHNSVADSTYQQALQ
ncbi:MAG: hypothetical protein ACR2KB_12770 [Chitinophagaceae bacterium]